ncbi:MAG: serine/threonine protein kinase, partial [Planctomycetaceae bacterium]
MSGDQLDDEAIFSVARRIGTSAARVEYLHQACGADRALFDRVAGLLRVYTEESDFLESPLIKRGDTAAAVLAAVSEMPGAAIGPYKLLEQIGVGGMGLVFMAEQQRPMRRQVALKIIKPGMDTRQVIARFEAERQALAMMEHPHIARVLDAGATDSGR